MQYTVEYNYYNDEDKPCHKEEHDTVITFACAMMRLKGLKMVKGQTYHQYSSGPNGKNIPMGDVNDPSTLYMDL